MSFKLPAPTWSTNLVSLMMLQVIIMLLLTLESVLLNVGLKNVGLAQAASVNATIPPVLPVLRITDNIEAYGNMDPDQLVVKAMVLLL